MRLDVKQAAVALGLTFATGHLAWNVLVALTGGGIIGYALTVHHIGGVAATALPLDAANLVVGTVLAFVSGAFFGALFALIWNTLGKER
ncbi:MAG: hypothetical protein AB1529_01010 [Candidatus Micrarchaeota archaeon]